MFIGQDLLRTTQGEHLLFPPLFFSLFAVFDLALVCFYQSLGPSFCLCPRAALCFISPLSLYSVLPTPPQKLHFLSILLLPPFCFPSPSSPAVHFHFVLFWDPFISPPPLASNQRCLFAGGVHLVSAPGWAPAQACTHGRYASD